MSVPISVPWAWAQMLTLNVQGLPDWAKGPVMWTVAIGDPTLTVPAWWGGLLTWVKIVGILCLIAWVFSWVAAALRERTAGRGSWVDFVGLAGLGVGLVAVVLQTRITLGLMKPGMAAGQPVVSLLAYFFGVCALIWIEWTLWSTIRSVGKKKGGAGLDLAVLVGLHLAIVLTAGVMFILRRAVAAMAATPAEIPSWAEMFVYGARLCATYMGFVVFASVVYKLVGELVALRARRIYGIGRVSIYEANRRMWAPWVVITVFAVVLAFTHWFLKQPPRPAEFGRLYVTTLTVLTSTLITLMVTILTPISLPYDIQQQTIYTIVSKPVRRLEMVWGRLFGFMTIVTILVGVFGGISLLYLRQTVGQTIRATDQAAAQARAEGRDRDARKLAEQADQLRTRMSARRPVRGSLTFIDSRGTPQLRGIDVGQEQSTREPRSHIEGGTVSTGIWAFGVLQDPYQPTNSRAVIDRRIPVEEFLKPESVEGLLDKVYSTRFLIEASERERAQPNLPAARSKELSDVITRNKTELDRAEAAYKRLKAQFDDLLAKANAASDKAQAASLRAEARRLKSDPVRLEMTFTVYRTTKGQSVGEAVLAQIEAVNPVTGANYKNLFPVREYYTNKLTMDPELLAGSGGRLNVRIKCITNNQYLGMAESDLFLLAPSDNFGLNFMKGLFGVWLQALVLTAIGLFAGTFLSWPVALLTTFAFFMAGQLAFSSLIEFARQSLVGGGPFESLIRLLSHVNQVSDLTPTIDVVIAKTLDSLVVPIMSRLVYVVPNLAAFDVGNIVANGFAVSKWTVIFNFLLALGYVIPFTIAGYFILKNREVAA